MCRSIVLALVITVAAIAVGPAADDIRFSYHSGSESFSFQPPGMGTVDEKWGDSRRLEIGLWNVAGASSWGISGIQHKADYGEDIVDLEYESMGARLYFAQAYPFSQALSLDFQSFIGWSRTDLKLRIDEDRYDDNNWMYEYGLMAQLIFASNPREGLIVAAGGGYLFTRGDFSIDGSKKFEQEGFFLTGTVGWRF